MSTFLDYPGLEHYDEKVKNETREVYDSYNDFQYVLRSGYYLSNG